MFSSIFGNSLDIFLCFLFLFSKTYNKSWPRDLPMLWPQPTSDGMMATVTSVFSAGRKDWIFYLNLNRIWMDKLLLYFKWVVQLLSYSWTHLQLHNNRIISLSRIAIWLDPYLVKSNKKYSHLLIREGATSPSGRKGSKDRKFSGLSYCPIW